MALVTGDQTMGGVRFVADDRLQPTAQPGQAMANVLAEGVATDSMGCGRKIATGAEFALSARLLTAAIS